MVRTNIQRAAKHETPVLMVVSPEENELQSLITSKLAVSFAEIGKQVLLVDVNFRKPTLHDLFSIDQMTGLSNILNDEEEGKSVISEVFIRNLYVLPAGFLSVHSKDIERIEQLIIEWKRRYDVVILEAPAFLEVVDSQILSDACSGVIVVIHENHTKKEDALKTKKMLERAGNQILGAIYQTS
jgi:capsular exopolysaccharide synthesis family protein